LLLLDLLGLPFLSTFLLHRLLSDEVGFLPDPQQLSEQRRDLSSLDG
jgi:hypothetical protein